MSYQDGWSALNLEMPGRVPRTEYSASNHWQLVSTVTGIPVDHNSSPEQQAKARSAFEKAWNYDFVWATLISRNFLNEKRTRMGHAVYASGGVDYSDEVVCPFTEPEEVLDFDPWETYGVRDKETIKQQFEDHYRAQVAANDQTVNMTGIYITCISGLIEIFGWDMLLLAAGDDPEAFGEMTNRYASWIQQYYEALAETSVPVIMMHDDIVWTSGAFIHPDWYRKYVFPNFKKYLEPVLASGKKVLFTADGNFTQFIDDIAACGVHGFVMEPSTDMRYIAEKYGKTHIFAGNADTRILLRGTKEQIETEVKRCMDIGKSCPGFFMAVGNHIPSNTPVENALYYNECYERLGRR